MTTQNHMIKKQVLDLTLDSEVGSFVFQSRVSEVFRNKIVPLIEDYCSQISGDSGTIRIDRLEVDLGVIGRKNFENDFKRNFDKLFPEQLAKALKISPGEKFLPIFEEEGRLGESIAITDEVRDFEILEFFIGEGRLPWWVRMNESQNITALFTRIITSQPVKAKELITKAVGNSSMVKRLVYNIEEAAIEKILELFQPCYAQEIYNLSQNLMTQIAGCPLIQTSGFSKIRFELWSSVLSWSVASEGQIFKQNYLVDTIIKDLANNFDLDFNALYNYVTEKIGMKDKRILNQFTHGVVREVRKNENFKTEEYAHYLFILENELKKLQTALINCNMTTFLFSMRWFLQRLTPKVTRSIKTIQSIRMMIEGFQKRFDGTRISEIDTDLEKRVEQLEKRLGKIQDDALAFLHMDLSKMDFDVVKNVENLVKMMERVKKEADSKGELTDRDSNGDTEELFVNNAGIVLLWPYLTRFFEAIGITKENHFIDKEAAGRAALFLHYLASGAVTTQEYELALNKILCGMKPDYPVNPYLEMTKEETSECEDLLQAVIRNWPALKKMSVSAFRSLFLMREGMIFFRAGQRVLRVDNQAHDILLDKMPWGIGSVKLPWMEQILIVEWRI
jgi:hypothetical protein